MIIYLGLGSDITAGCIKVAQVREVPPRCHFERPGAVNFGVGDGVGLELERIYMNVCLSLITMTIMTMMRQLTHNPHWVDVI